MTKSDGYKAALLDFLMDDLVGAERDAVIRAFYEYAEGDARGHPVGIAVLLTTCTRRMSRLPENVRLSATEFQALLDKLTQVDKDLTGKIANQLLQWKNDLDFASCGFMGGLHGEISRALAAFENENAQALTAHQKENARTETSWKQAAERLSQTQEEVELTGRRLIPVADSARQVAQHFASLKVELGLHQESHQRAIDAVESLKVVHQENKKRDEETQVLIKALTKEARANWTTMGYLAGIFLAALFYHLPWWGTWGSFAGMLGLLQWLSRRDKKPSQKQPDEPAAKVGEETQDQTTQATVKEVGLLPPPR